MNNIMEKLVSEIMDSNFLCVNRTQKVRDLLKIIPKKRYTHTLVVDEGAQIVGVISQKDIIGYFMGLLKGGMGLSNIELDEMTVESLMTKTPVTVKENDVFGFALELFIEKGFHILPVVNDNSNIVGIITFDTLLFELKIIMNKSKNKPGFDFENHRISSGWMYHGRH